MTPGCSGRAPELRASGAADRGGWIRCTAGTSGGGTPSTREQGGWEPRANRRSPDQTRSHRSGAQGQRGSLVEKARSSGGLDPETGPQFRAEECVPASGHSRHLRAPPRGVGCLWSRVATPRWQDQLGDEGHAPRERKFQLSQDRAEARPPRPGRRRSTARPAAGWAPRRACKGSGATDPRAARSPPPRGGTSRLSP